VPFKTALRDLTAVLDRGGQISPDCQAVSGLFCQFEHDVDQLLETAVVASEIYAKSVAGRTARATLPRPAPTPAAVSKPTTTGVLLLHASQWTDHSGVIQRAAAYWDVELPPTVAQRALTAGVVIGSNDPRAAQKRKERLAINAYDPERLVALDSVDPQPPSPPNPVTINPSSAVWQMPGDTPRPWISRAPT
jgi:hypothetical protein